MNVNLTPVTDASKTTKVASEGGDKAVESSESGGFFSKLKSLISGEEPKGDATVKGGEKTAKSEAKTDAKSETSDASKAQVSEKTAESESTKKVLAATDGEDANTKGAKSAKTAKASDSDVEQVAKSKNNSKATGEDDTKVQSQKQAKQAMDEGDELLTRLNDSNNSLKDKNGKALPQDAEDSAQSQVKQSSLTESSNVVAKQNQGKAEGQAQLAAEGAVATKQLKNGQPLPEQQQAAEASKATVAAQSGQVQENGQQSKVASNASNDEVPESLKPFIKQQGDGQGKGEQYGAAMSESDSTAPRGVVAGVAAARIAEHEANKESLNSDKLTKGQDGETSAKVAGSMGAAAVSQSGQLQQPNSQGSIASGQLTTQSIDSAASSADIPSEVAPTAIAWGSPAPTDPKMAIDSALTPEKMMQSQAQQQVTPNTAALMAGSAAAINAAQSSQVAQPNGTPPALDTNAMNNPQMQAMLAQGAVPPTVSANASNQAALKAALGVGAAAGLAESGKSKDSKDASLAAQLGAAAGAQQSMQGAQGAQGSVTRAEAAQVAQTPMQLTREMAGDQVAERVQMMMSKNLKNIDIRLDPPELGRMQIRMNMNGDAPTVQFTVNNQQARDVIEQSMPRLREMMAQQGIQLGDASVSQQSSGQQGRYAAGNGASDGQGVGGQQGIDEENLEPDVNLDLNVASKRDGISYYA
ncbi:flagellar hook-length control protein FliK [Vibrio mexicanus]|uniref:flagellar hook-length control protein FliK n=1 Tax=Vibrio mexicanus TaxID=1004326 RepID=UPI0006998912|nr:flagellar hook-length control protein FliK [Vibrio mexicanus]